MFIEQEVADSINCDEVIEEFQNLIAEQRGLIF